MTFEIVGKNGFQVTQAIQEYAEKKLSKIDKFFQQDIQKVRVVLKVYPNFHKVEVTIHADHVTIRAEEKASDMYEAIDVVSDKMMTQVKRYQGKQHQHKHHKTEQKPSLSMDALEKDVFAKQLVRNKKITLEPMTIEDAIDHMEQLDHDFFIFLDKKTHQSHLLYKRDDGDYAVIETELDNKKDA
ncbi:MAG: ribosome hibernation-promoting factor, HPF/YfiA family [Acholeplasmataceae bacterium]